MTCESTTLRASELKERGWTEKLIRTVLGEPDERRKNPDHRSAVPMRLYFMGRVLDAEQQPSVRARLQRIAELRSKRSATAKAAPRSRQRAQSASGPAGKRAQRKTRKGKQNRPRFNAADYRMAESLCRRSGSDNEVASKRALTERDSHLYRARVEAARRNHAAASDHRRAAERLNRVSELLVEWSGMERRRGGHRDSGDLLPRRKGARLRTGRPRQGH